MLRALLVASVLLSGLPLCAQFRAFPSNEKMGVDPDRYIGNPFQSLARVSHEVMLTRSILTAGDPHKPGDPGAVLQYRKDFATATLLPRNVTPLSRYPDQFIFFVERGEGRLDNGKEYWDLREGITFLIPPDQPHRLTNLGDTPLEMLMLRWENPAGVTPRKDILVKDVHVLPIAEKNAHWSYMAKNLFHPSDGLHPNEKILIVYMAPMTIGSPHPHPPDWEEVWTKMLPDEPALLMLGSEIRDMPAHTGFIAPPNGETVHTVFNLSRDKVQSWFYFARYTRPAPDYTEDPAVPSKPLR
ncbi:MAG: cupin domain-containing protein [Bryobacterales bacterium]|nr:cupin domain-containing protein [Bryobacterales bacterium]